MLHRVKDPPVVGVLAGIAISLGGLLIGWYEGESIQSNTILTEGAASFKTITLVSLALAVGVTTLSALRNNYNYAVVNMMLLTFVSVLVYNSRSVSQEDGFPEIRFTVGFWMTLVGSALAGLASLLMLATGVPRKRQSV